MCDRLKNYMDQELSEFERNIENELIESCKYLDAQGLESVRKAYHFAALAHRGQMRLSGDPCIVHLWEATKILLKYKLDPIIISTCLMHDLIEENTGVTLDFIKENFGSEQAMLIKNVTKLTGLFSEQEKEEIRKEKIAKKSKTRSDSLEKSSVENLRKIFLAMSRDLRVIIVKFADRLHNLRTLEYCDPLVRQSIARESLDIFVPIASRLGIWEFKAEMENLAFQYAYPEEYKKLTDELNILRPRYEKALEKVVEIIKERLEEMNTRNEIEYRFKSLYSVFRKMKKAGKTLAEVYDLVALRIMVGSKGSCYKILGEIHQIWTPMDNRIKDYIARPKDNNYQCLHTTITGPDDVPLEVQIRTFEMHRVNEIGVAAHWAYKEGHSADKNSRDIFAQIHPWIRALFNWQNEGGNEVESSLSQHVKVDLLKKDIFAFTPVGDVINLPVGSTPIDFAYRIHTDVGHRCVGAIVNGKMVSLDYKLATADVVEIKTAKNGIPSRDWLRICASHQAISKIRAWFKKERRDENILRGREAFKSEAKRLRLVDLSTNEELLLKVAQHLSFLSIDDLMASIGYGENTAAQILGRMQNMLPKTLPEPEVEENTSLPTSSADLKQAGSKREIIIQGIDTMLTKMAQCCTPVPGDKIIGYVTIGKGVSIHRSDCINLADLQRLHPERIVQCQWNKRVNVASNTYTVQLNVDAWDRNGLVADLLSCLKDIKVKVKSCQANTIRDKARVKLTIEVTNSLQMEESLKALRGVRSVSSATRAKTH
ncbi:bifunctional (p)ppGpp synthetase/guanosine-3',5'-bis(diphosphate) 3'-pyrophosphohydrolase [bacterium]|nr:bifunctional (p)ppGpp synthetase/guanosine-3',5'-bis(diphosphate) 3'-pyrophosphohydrolase [bacterium]